MHGGACPSKVRGECATGVPSSEARARNPTLSAAAAHGRRGADPGDPGPGHEVWKVRRPAHHGVAAECGWPVGKDRVQRIWQREGLKVPQKPRPRGRLWLHEGSCIRLRPERANPVWSYDFGKGRPHGGRALRILVLIDEYTRECLALPVARRLGRLLTDLINPIIGNDTLFNAAKFVPPNREGPTATSSTKPEVTGVMGIVCQLGTADEQSLQPKPWV